MSVGGVVAVVFTPQVHRQAYNTDARDLVKSGIWVLGALVLDLEESCLGEGVLCGKYKEHLDVSCDTQ